MEGENIVYKRTLLLRKCNKSMYTVVLHPKYTKLVKVQLCKFAKGNKTNRKTKNSASNSACSLQKRTCAFGWPQNYCASQSDQLTKLQVVLVSLDVSLSNNMAPKH